MMYFPVTQPVFVLVGPTAIGKTALSLQMAEEFDCEIVSMDSMQVYRYMDIGTAKATREEREKIPHHLIDIVDPDEDYDAERFIIDACTSIADIHAREKIPLITGGTGLYLKALIEGLFPGGTQYPQIRAELQERLHREGSLKLHEELSACDSISAKRIHYNDTQRLIRALEIYHGSGTPWSQHIHEQKKESGGKRFQQMLLIGLTCERDTLYEQINRRTCLMIDSGLEDEVRGLLHRGYSSKLNSMMSIGYRHMVMYIQGIWGKSQMETFLARDTRRYAKRQYTWFRKTPDIQWVDKNEEQKILSLGKKWLAECS
jgi:tRNA dimethylallyltransferase